MSHKDSCDKGRQEGVVVDLHTNYPIIAKILREHFNFQINDSSSNDWDLHWMDLATTPEHVGKMKPFQKTNHFPNMCCLHKKNQLGINLSKMYRKFYKEYEFFPRTWVLPGDWNCLKIDSDKNSNKTYIIKPEGLGQGKGIFLTKDIDKISPFERCIVQRYIHNPYLIDGLKFDLRLYVLLYGCDPLRIYIFKEGLARFSTEEYLKPTKQNLQNQFIHLTNYAINKFNKKFIFNSDANNSTVGHKRSLASVWDYIDKHGGNSTALKDEINDIIVKTFCAVQPQLSRSFHVYQPTNLNNNMCFEILGVDILIDDDLKPWLLEINHAPSFSIDTPLDEKVKTKLLIDTFTLLHITPESRRKYIEKERQNVRIYGKISYTPNREEKEKIRRDRMIERDNYEMEHCGEFIRIYPNSELSSKYESYIDYARTAMNQSCGLRSKHRSIPSMIISSVRANKSKSPTPKVGNSKLHKRVIIKTRLQDLAQMRLDIIATIYNSKSFKVKTKKNSKMLITVKNYFPSINGFLTTKAFHKKGNKKFSTNVLPRTTTRYNAKDSLSTRQTLHE